MQEIDQLMLFPENVNQQRIKYYRRINTTDPSKLCTEAAGMSLPLLDFWSNPKDSS